MNSYNISEIIEKQKNFFYSGATLPINFRKTMLKKLYASIKSHEEQILNALKTDLGKSNYEGFMCEIGISLSEISYMIKHVSKFAKEKSVRTPIAQFAAHSYTKPTPYGNTLIMSPWNYPFLLSIEPLANAIAAGNTCILKPSAYSSATADILKIIIEDCFSTDYIAVITGGREQNASLLQQKFDFIFFTGSQNVGKEVLKQAAPNLTPAVLELGGKSPCIVDSSAKIQLAAKRIIFGKLLNCGQTCVAPDYILCHKSIKDELIQNLKAEIVKQYGKDPLNNNDYGKIINQKHFDRLLNLIDPSKIYFGGKSDLQKLKIEPTIVDNVSWNDKIMEEEIFGPILPILTFDNIQQIITILQHKPKPLALYIFSEDKKNIKQITNNISYGGGCINDTIIHLATCNMGFGGVGESGMGSYHGKEGFNAFSHTKSIVDKKTWIDLPIRYQPYTNKFYQRLLRLFLK